MFGKLVEKIKEFTLSMKWKLILSFSLIATTLVVSCAIAVMEYTRMNTYVSDLIAANIKNINVAQGLASISNDYNLNLLTVIGDDGENVHIPSFNQNDFLDRCDSLRVQLSDAKMLPLADSVLYSYSAYMLTSLELQSVLLDDFTDTRDWYFGRLQPKYNRLRHDIDVLTEAIYDDLQKNSFTFQRGFYRSVIPGAVSVGVAFLLIVMLLFYLLAYYVRPIRKMHTYLEQSKKSETKKYSYTFDGDDELKKINDDITTIVENYQQLKKRANMNRYSSNDR